MLTWIQNAHRTLGRRSPLTRCLTCRWSSQTVAVSSPPHLQTMVWPSVWTSLSPDPPAPPSSAPPPRRCCDGLFLGFCLDYIFFSSSVFFFPFTVSPVLPSPGESLALARQVPSAQERHQETIRRLAHLLTPVVLLRRRSPPGPEHLVLSKPTFHLPTMFRELFLSSLV